MGLANNLRYCGMLPKHEHNSAIQWLFVSDAWVPEYDTNTGARCSRQYLELFSSLGYRIVFLPQNGNIIEPYTSQLESLGIIVIFSYNPVEWISKNIERFDYFYLQRPCSLDLIRYIQKHRKPNTKLLYFDHDLHYLRLRRQGQLQGNQSTIAESYTQEEIEDEIFDLVDIIYVAGEYEKNIVEGKQKKKLVRDIPVVLFEQSAEVNISNSFNERKDLIYVGGYSHQPNIDAVLWFLDNVWGQVQELLPGAVFHIVGSNPPKSFYDRRYSNISVSGRVSENALANMYKKARIMVVPLRYGAGVKGKILEAMASYLPVITTEIGAEGIIKKEKYLTIANTAEEWRKVLPELYKNEEVLWNKAMEGRLIIDSYYSFSTMREIIIKDMPVGL
jgi:glycosyltransferase involved in cell wall biosynthesis